MDRQTGRQANRLTDTMAVDRPEAKKTHRPHHPFTPTNYTPTAPPLHTHEQLTGSIFLLRQTPYHQLHALGRYEFSLVVLAKQHGAQTREKILNIFLGTIKENEK